MFVCESPDLKERKKERSPKKKLGCGKQPCDELWSHLDVDLWKRMEGNDEQIFVFFHHFKIIYPINYCKTKLSTTKSSNNKTPNESSNVTPKEKLRGNFAEENESWSSCLVIVQCSRDGDEYVTLWKYFLHGSLVIYLFRTPPLIKLKLGLQIGGRLLYKPPFWLANQKQGTVVRSYLLHSFLGRCEALLCHLPSSTNCTEKKSCAKIILLNQTGMSFYFSSSNFNLQAHILSIGGVKVADTMSKGSPPSLSVIYHI